MIVVMISFVGGEELLSYLLFFYSKSVQFMDGCYKVIFFYGDEDWGYFFYWVMVILLR